MTPHSLEPTAPSRYLADATTADIAVLRRFVDDAPGAVAMFDTELRFLAASRLWCDRCSLDRSTIEGRELYDLSPEAKVYRAVHARCLGGVPESGEDELIVPSTGTVIWARWDMQPWHTRSGEIGGLIIRVANISMQRAEHAELADREHQLQISLDASNAGIWTMDMRARRITWDRRSEAMFGLGLGTEVSLDRTLDAIPEPDRTRVVAILDRVTASTEDRDWGEEFRVRRADGTERWIYARGRPERDETGQVARIVGINLDVTERRRAEAAMRERERLARLALEAASGLAWSWTPDGNLHLAEDSAGDDTILPFDREEYLSHVHPDDRERLRAAMAAGRADHGESTWDLEYRHVEADGRLTWFHSRGTVERDADGRTRRLVGIKLDVTARKQAELEVALAHAELQERAAELERRTSQLRRLASELTYAEQRTREGIAKLLHDHLQQLLFSALMKVERASARTAAPELLVQVQRELKDAIEETRTLSAELLPSTLRRGDLPGALHWLAGWLQTKYGVTVHAVLDSRANPDREDVRFLLYESVRELLFNAVKHGAVSEVQLALAMDGADHVRIVVADAGVGFDPKTLMASDATDGGLGLFAIRERLVGLGGCLDVQSSPGHGARFTLVVPGRHVTLSTATETAQGAEDTSTRGTRTHGPLRLLLVDDHAAVRESLRDALSERAEFTVVGEASNGVEAIELAQALTPDVIIMDVSMPQMDGLEATRRIRALQPHVRIYGLSTQEESSKLHAIEAAGADGYFSKGVGIARLMERLSHEARSVAR